MSQNYYRDKLGDALTAEEYKHTQKLLEPLHIEPDRKDKMERALTKIDQYKSGNSGSQANAAMSKKKPSNFDILPTFEGINKYLQGASDKPSAGGGVLSQSSGFSTLDTNPIKGTLSNTDIRLEHMITLGLFKSSSGTVKKMLHAPSLKIYCVKEVPIINRESRSLLKEWIS